LKQQLKEKKISSNQLIPLRILSTVSLALFRVKFFFKVYNFTTMYIYMLQHLFADFLVISKKI